MKDYSPNRGRSRSSAVAEHASIRRKEGQDKSYNIESITVITSRSDASPDHRPPTLSNQDPPHEKDDDHRSRGKEDENGEGDGEAIVGDVTMPYNAIQ
uniref:Uncharacterized protein n=1 Tax=Pristionchus pacificus TaxID=54126 RepID=A0A2A6CMA0_PRIPA|eukprot:PDM79334.1 hypothetical protein PRIPAC_31913 [Pristionchus pacificus]